MRHYVKRTVLWILCLTLITGTIFLPMTVAGENESISSSQWSSLLNQYFSHINAGNYIAAVQMHHTDLQNDLASTYMNVKNIENHVGISNIQSGTIEDITLLSASQVEQIVNENEMTEYEDYAAALITADLQLYVDERYLKNGTNYLCPVVVKDGEQWWMYSLIVPTESELANLQAGEVMPLGMDTPTGYDDYNNPETIKVKHTTVYDGENYTLNEITVVDFKQYCKVVTSCEVGYANWNLEALKANALAIKTFAFCRIKHYDASRSYHVTNSSSSDQCYNTAKTLITKCNTAVDEIWYKIILDKNDCVFPTFYRNGNSTATTYKNYGLLNQQGSNTLANDGYTYTQILNYYYDRVSGVDYYNTQVPVGAIQVVNNHTHNYGAWTALDNEHSRSCSVCGLVIKGAHNYSTWTYYSTTEHQSSCTACKKIVRETHELTSWTYDTASLHKSVCTDCGGVIRNTHIFIDYGSIMKCAICQYSMA